MATEIGLHVNRCCLLIALANSLNVTSLQDTNLCPDIEIRMMLAPNTVLASTNTAVSRYTLKNFSFSVESISFGDGSYRAMVDSRMASGDPLLIPFFNWVGFEGTAGDSTFQQQFTIATESLNGLIGTVRPGNYDSQVLPQIGGNGAGAAAPFTASTSNCSFYVPQTTGVVNDNSHPISLPTNTFINWYHAAMSLEQTAQDRFGPGGQWGAGFQFK